ncbi:MAG TPA: hypothetical protein VMV90_08745 [Rectinemataceae bacterium]|nr:hypothetical protein [Rectinemataceae bacterium]
MDISEGEGLIRLEAASDDAISDFYRRDSDRGSGRLTEDVLKRAIAEELGKNRVRLPEVPRSFSGELRLPIITLALSLAFAVAVVSLSLHSFGVQEERLFLDPSALFSTESLLIDTLKRQSDLSLAERDRLIADYQARAKIRESYLQALQSVERPRTAAPPGKAAPPSAPLPEAATSIPAPRIAATPPSPQEAALASLSDSASLDAYYTSRLYGTLEAVAEDMRKAQPGRALDALSGLGSTLKLPAARNSAAARSALRIVSALSLNLTQLSRSSAISSKDGDSAIAALAVAAKERLKLLGRMASLEAEIELLKSERASRASTEAKSPPAAAGTEAPIRSTSPSMDLSRREAPPLAEGPALPEPSAPQAQAPMGRPLQEQAPEERKPAAQAPAAQAPAALVRAPSRSEPAGGAAGVPLSAFIGTVSVVAGTTVLIDLVAGARIGVGSTVLLYRPSPSGAGELVAVALVESVHLSTAELKLRSLARPGEAPRLRDTIYASP